MEEGFEPDDRYFPHIRYTMLNKEHKLKGGVYVMIIGDYFYVGITNNFLNRYLSHMSDQRNAMYDYLEKGISFRASKAIGKVLAEDRRINNVYFIIVDLCDSSRERYILERTWIKAFDITGYKRLLLNQTNLLV